MSQSKLIFPQGVDHKKFLAFHKKAVFELNKDFRGFHNSQVEKNRELIKSSGTASQLLGISRKRAKELHQLQSESRKSRFRSLKRLKPLTGHNPARYAPYSFPWSSLNAGGIGGASLYDVNATYGSLGADLQDYFGGSGSAASAVGFWYQAQHTGNLFVNAQIYIDGGAEVSALPGYANANAFVKVFVQQYQPYYSLSGQSTVYDRSEYAFGVDFDKYIQGYYSASIVAPIMAGGWYCLWAALYQHVTVGGIGSARSDFVGSVGPIIYIEI